MTHLASSPAVLCIAPRNFARGFGNIDCCDPDPMKFAALQKLRQKLAADQPVYGVWVTLESPSVTEMAVALGLDWVGMDAGAGARDWTGVVADVCDGVPRDP